MAVNQEVYKSIKKVLDARGVTLVAVSKTKPVEEILELYDLGQRDFGENYVQELVEKQAQLPKDIRWHFIGHLQSNKVKLIVPFVQLIHGVDSLKLLQEINKQAEKNKRVIDCLLQLHIAEEETKFGLDENELKELLKAVELNPLPAVRITGLMGMASFGDDMDKVRSEFKKIKAITSNYTPDKFPMISMGMSGDYNIAIEEGSTMVRIGSLLFGSRQ